MAERREMPQRRECHTFPVELINGAADPAIVTVGYYADGSVGEVFVSNIKSGMAMDALARDAAVMLSMSLQHGIPLATIGRAMTRNGNGEPSGLMGILVDKLIAEGSR